MKFEPARRATLGDLAAMTRLAKQPGRNVVGPRSLAFCHPNHSQETLEAYFAIHQRGVFVSEQSGKIISFLCAIRTSEGVVKTSIPWSDAFDAKTELSHQKRGDWFYVSRLAYTAGPGHAHLANEIGPLIAALQHQALQLDLTGVAFPLPFQGFRERSGTNEFQRSAIDDPNSQERTGLRPIGMAYALGFRHEIALPNYLGDARHFALMVWKAKD